MQAPDRVLALCSRAPYKSNRSSSKARINPKDSQFNKLIPFGQIRVSKTHDIRTENLL